MSPEQALRRAVDGRSDLYSLGSVMFEILAGEPTVSQGSDLELLKRIVYETVPPLASRVSGADPELAALVDRMLAKAADQRPPDGASVARALDAWLTSRALVAPVMRARLGELANRFGAARRRRLRKLLAAEGTELGSSSSWRDPRRVRPASPPGPGTFLRAAVPGSTRGAGRRRRHRLGASRLERHARVSAASSPALAPPVPRVERMPAPPPRTRATATDTGATRRVSVAPPPPRPAPAPSKRVTWVPVIGGVAMALLLILVVAFFGMRKVRSEPAPVAAPPPPPETELGPLDPTPPVQTATAPEIPPMPAAPAPRAGQKRPPAARVQSAPSTKSRSKPCTPDRFDYPACLSGR
jgi:hypothetical protein